MNFADGRIKGYDVVMPGGITKTFFVQCVRGDTTNGVTTFVDNGDGTITDLATNLMWTRLDSGTGVTWQDGLAWVQTENAQNRLGHADWRMPNAKELQSIVDYTRASDANDPAFRGPAINAHFSCTQITNGGEQPDYPCY